MIASTEPDTAQERAALVAWHLAHGEGMTTQDVADLCGFSRVSGWRLMMALCRVLPIYQTENGVWEVLFLKESHI